MSGTTPEREAWGDDDLFEAVAKECGCSVKHVKLVWRDLENPEKDDIMSNPTLAAAVADLAPVVRRA